jgi:dienelactone hydrolase
MPWLARHPRDRVLADADAAIAYAKEKWPGLPISAVGFCWGGLYAALLAGGSSPRVDAAALLHPSLMTPADVEGIARPVFVATNGEDQQVSPEFRAQIQSVLAAKPFPTASQHWEEMRHGWTLRGDDKDEKIAAAAEEAFNQTADWFTVHASKE